MDDETTKVPFLESRVVQTTVSVARILQCLMEVADIISENQV